MEKQRVIYLDIIKILAILLVIYNHSHWDISYYGITGNIHHFLYSFCKCAVPLFIMVTGALLLKRETTYKEVFTKRIFRLIPPLIIVIGLYTIINGYGVKDFFLSLFFPGYPYWMWYVYLLIALYLVTPLLQKMVKNMKDKDFIYFILIFVVGCGIVQEIPVLTNFFLGKAYTLHGGFVSGLFTVEIGLYVAGYYLSQKKISAKLFKVSVLVFLVNVIINTILFRLAISRGLTYDNVLLYGHFLVVVMSLCLFIIIKYLFSKPFKNKKLTSLIITLSNSVFGVYLFHPFLLDLFISMKWMRQLVDLNSLIGVMILNIIVFVILSILVYFARKIPYVKKFL